MTEQRPKVGGTGIGVPWGHASGAGSEELDALSSRAAECGRPVHTPVQHLSMLDPNSGFENHGELERC